MRDDAPALAAVGCDPLANPGEEIETVVRDRLLVAAVQPEADTCKDWKDSGIALLRCGTLFCAVRITAQLVHAVVGTGDPHGVDAYLEDALLGGPVFTDRTCQRYYALVSANAEDEPRWKTHEPHAAYLAEGSFLGVPDPAHTTWCGASSYWCVPIRGPGALCTAEIVEQLLLHGRYLLAGEEGKGDV